MTIRLATENDGDALHTLLSTVFEDDPLTGWFIRQDILRRNAFELFFNYVLNTYCLPYGECWVTNTVSGAALWMPPGKWALPLPNQITSLPKMLSIFGMKHLIKKLQDRYLIDRHHPKHPHYYLSALAVSTPERHRGIGSNLLKPVIQRSDKEGVGCYLETSRERNIIFYERHGFSIMKKIYFSPNKLPLWCMWRAPQRRIKRRTSPTPAILN